MTSVRAVVARRRLLFARNETVERVRQRIEGAGVSSSLIICATPRTGSTMLADVLAASGSVGLALEHFNHNSLPPEAPIRLGDFLVERAGKKGETSVFGLKLIWYQLDLFLTRLKALRGAGRITDGQLIAAALPEPRYVWITRDDVVAQAVSWWRAKSTRVWRDDDRPVADATFDYSKVDELVRLARVQNAAWEGWFEKNTVTPLHVTYEMLVADPVAVARRSLGHLGIEPNGGFAPRPRTRKQADTVNAEWISRYREESTKRGDAVRR